MPDNRTPNDHNAPVAGQPAAIVAADPGGPYLARFPYEAAGGRDNAHRAATSWRDRYAAGAAVLGFTGQVRLVWEEAAEIAPGEYSRAIMAGYGVEESGGLWYAMTPDGDTLAENLKSERAAWEACDRHRMFGESAANRAAMRTGYCVRATTTYEAGKAPRPGFMAIPPWDAPDPSNLGTFDTEAGAWAACEAHRAGLAG